MLLFILFCCEPVIGHINDDEFILVKNFCISHQLNLNLVSFYFIFNEWPTLGYIQLFVCCLSIQFSQRHRRLISFDADNENKFSYAWLCTKIFFRWWTEKSDQIIFQFYNIKFNFHFNRRRMKHETENENIETSCDFRSWITNRN